MFAHLIAPLDGSRLAESVLPAVEALGRHLDARVTLLHVLESRPPATVHGERHLTGASEANSYLESIAARLAGRGIKTACNVRSAPDGVPVAISAAATDLDADVIVLCTHGGSGLRTILYGRVAQQVLARGTVPVLLIPSLLSPAEEAFVCRRVLVPLDGSAAAELALPPAARLALAFTAEVLLMWVVPTAATISDERAAATKLMPTAADALLDAEAGQAAAYLEQVRLGLARQNVAASAAVERGDPARFVQDLADRDADLVVMATHGEAGVASLVSGSLGARLVAQLSCPALLIRIPQASG